MSTPLCCVPKHNEKLKKIYGVNYPYSWWYHCKSIEVGSIIRRTFQPSSRNVLQIVGRQWRLTHCLSIDGFHYILPFCSRASMMIFPLSPPVSAPLPFGSFQPHPTLSEFSRLNVLANLNTLPPEEGTTVFPCNVL